MIEVLLFWVNVIKNEDYFIKGIILKFMNEVVFKKNIIKIFFDKVFFVVINVIVGILSGVIIRKINIKIKDKSVVLDLKINNSVDIVKEKE